MCQTCSNRGACGLQRRTPSACIGHPGHHLPRLAAEPDPGHAGGTRPWSKTIRGGDSGANSQGRARGSRVQDARSHCSRHHRRRRCRRGEVRYGTTDRGDVGGRQQQGRHLAALRDGARRGGGGQRSFRRRQIGPHRRHVSRQRRRPQHDTEHARLGSGHDARSRERLVTHAPCTYPERRGVQGRPRGRPPRELRRHQPRELRRRAHVSAAGRSAHAAARRRRQPRRHVRT